MQATRSDGVTGREGHGGHGRASGRELQAQGQGQAGPSMSWRSSPSRPCLAHDTETACFFLNQ